MSNLTNRLEKLEQQFKAGRKTIPSPLELISDEDRETVERHNEERESGITREWTPEDFAVRRRYMRRA